MSDLSKRKILFDLLESAEKTMIAKDSILHQDSINNTSYLSSQTQTNYSRNVRNFRGKKESIFKTPAAPISKCLKPRVAPGYQKNPQKWKKYSLSDVDISDQTNISAAFEFMRTIESQHQISDLEGSSTKELNSKITFNRSSNVRRNLRSVVNDDDSSDKPKLKGSKLIMPEYVVGQKIKPISNSKKNEKVLLSNKKMLSLSHLMDDDDDVGV